MQPAVLIDLVLQLARRPAGITEREHRALGALAARDRLEDVERRGETDALVDRQRRVLDEEVARMQHEAPARLDRPALEHPHPSRMRRKLDQIGGGHHVELHQQVGKTDMRRRLIDDDAHGPFGGMGAHIDYAAGEPVIAHGRHRDQHLSIEVAALGTLALLRFGFAGRWFGDSRRAAPGSISFAIR